MLSANFIKYINIPFGASLLEFIAAGYYAREDINLANDIIILPSQRARRLLQDKILARKTTLVSAMPRIFTYAELHSNLIYFAPLMQNLNFNLPHEVSSIALDFLIAEIILSQNSTKIFSWHYINEIKRFLVEFFTYSANINALREIENKQLAELLINIIDALSARNLCLKQQARLKAIENICQADFKDTSNANLLMLAPSNASPGVLQLIKKLLTYNNSQLIFYGLNADKCPAQEAYHNILRELKISPMEVRNALEGKEFKEINQTSQSVPFWRGVDAALLKKVRIIPCINQVQEAQLVALIVKDKLYNCLSPNVAIICEEETLREQVIFALQKWGITPETSVAPTLNKFKVCQLFYNLLLLAVDFPQLDVCLLLSILKNPHFQLPVMVDEQWLGELEKKFLRPQLVHNLEQLRDYPGMGDFIQALGKLHSTCGNSTLSLAYKFKQHWQVFSQFANDINEDITATFAEIVDEINIHAHNCLVTSHQYVSWLHKTLASIKLRQTNEYHANVKMVTSIEAKFLDLDTIIFCGLNQGIFPSISPHSNLISASERLKLELPLGEINVQEQNLDFLNLLARSDVYLTYAKSINKENCQASIFIEKLQLYRQKFQPNYVEDNNYHLWLEKLNSSMQEMAQPSQTAANKPPLSARPQHYSAKSITELINNPYQFYAHYILQLKPLERLKVDLSSKNFGIILHNIIAKVLPAAHQHSCEEFVNKFIAAFMTEVTALPNQLEAKVSWPTRMRRIAGWLWQYERKLMQMPYQSSYPELKGRKELILAESYHVTLEATADRIITFSDNNALVIDYKTGTVPSKKEVKQGIAPQLPIEGWILAKGGYAKCLPTQIKFSYIKLTGKQEIGGIQEIEIDITQTEDELIKLISRFTLAEEAFFPAVPPYKSLQQYDPYQHLARMNQGHLMKNF